jgi:ADP-heptose:LPS heptosyltransferase
MPLTKFIGPLEPTNIAVRRCGSTLNAASKKILIVRLGSHGDILMGTPLIKSIRDAEPNAWITWVVERSSAEVLDANPYIDELLVWHGAEMLGRGGPHRLIARPFRQAWLKRELATRDFDTFISFQAEELLGLSQIINAKTKIGFFDYFNVKPLSASTIEEAHKLFNYVIDKAEHPVHRTMQYLSVLKYMGIGPSADLQMNLGFTEQDARTVTKVLCNKGVSSNEPYAVIAPMSTWTTRNWDLSRYAAVADFIKRELGLRVVVIGSRREVEPVRRMIELSSTRPVEVAGVFTFRGMSALINGAKLVLGGDSGPMHVAGALSTPYVAIFGATPINARAPMVGPGISLSASVPCGPCDWLTCSNSNHPLLCLDLISTDKVMDACRKAVLI